MRCFCILLFNSMSLTSSVHFPLRAHLNLDWPRFTQQPHVASGYYIGQCRFKEFPRGKGIGVALLKPGHRSPSALTCEFQGGTIAFLEDLSQFQDNLQTCIPSENVAPVLCFVGLFVQYFRKFQKYVFPSLFPKEQQGTGLSWQFANLQTFDAKEARFGICLLPSLVQRWCIVVFESPPPWFVIIGSILWTCVLAAVICGCLCFHT